MDALSGFAGRLGGVLLRGAGDVLAQLADELMAAADALDGGFDGEPEEGDEEAEAPDGEDIRDAVDRQAMAISALGPRFVRRRRDCCATHA